MSRGVLLVFAKQPSPGAVKTRMCPPFSPEQAAELYARLLADVLEASAGFAPRLGLEPLLAVHPASACAALARSAPPAFAVRRQRGASLGARMGWAVREAAAGGAERILLRGSDSPLLDAAAVAAVLRGLDQVDLAVCADRDGGYGLIGLRRCAPELFEHPMSTPNVLEQTLARARAAGLRAARVGESFDLDTAGDLAWLARARGPAAGQLCPRTLAFLDSEDLWRLAGLG